MALSAFYVQRMYLSYADFTGFSLSDAHLINGGILLGGIAALVISIWAWIVLYRSTAFTRKWLWAIAIAVSLFQISVRWIDGAWNINLLAIQFLGLGVMRAPDNPWVVTIGIPVFALAVLYIGLRHKEPLEPTYF